MGKQLFDEERLHNEIGASPGFYEKMAVCLNQEIERNVREALGKIELPALPSLMPPRQLVSGEIELLVPGWHAAKEVLKLRIDAVLKEYQV